MNLEVLRNKLNSIVPELECTSNFDCKDKPNLHHRCTMCRLKYEIFQTAKEIDAIVCSPQYKIKQIITKLQIPEREEILKLLEQLRV